MWGPFRVGSFHPSKEVSEGVWSLSCRLPEETRFHPSKEVSEVGRPVEEQDSKRRFHPSKEVSEAGDRNGQRRILARFPSL